MKTGSSGLGSRSLRGQPTRWVLPVIIGRIRPTLSTFLVVPTRIPPSDANFSREWTGRGPTERNSSHAAGFGEFGEIGRAGWTSVCHEPCASRLRWGFSGSPISHSPADPVHRQQQSLDLLPPPGQPRSGWFHQLGRTGGPGMEFHLVPQQSPPCLPVPLAPPDCSPRWPEIRIFSERPLPGVDSGLPPRPPKCFLPLLPG